MSGEKIVLILLLAVACYSQCNKIICNPTTTATGQCVNTATVDYVYISPCPSGTLCSQVTQNCYTPEPVYVTGLLPGIYTKNATQCLSGKTLSNFCTAGETCAVGANSCNAKLYCSPSTLKCTTLLADGAACPGVEAGQTCMRGYQCYNSKCTPQMGLPDYMEIIGGVCTKNANAMCKSGSCYIATNLTAYCIPAPVSSYKQITACSIAPAVSICDTKNFTLGGTEIHNITNACACGMNKNGLSYCPSSPGDTYNQKYMDYMMAWMMSSDYDSCNYAVTDMECAQSHWGSDYIKMNYLMYLASDYSLLTDVENCALIFYYDAFVLAKEAYDHDKKSSS